MRVSPVLDLYRGVVVLGRGGRRDEYRPIASPLAGNAQPASVALGLRSAFGLAELYLADLDAIVDGKPNTTVWSELVARGWRPLVDAGIDSVAAAQQVIAIGATPIVGLESCGDPALLGEILATCGTGNVIFSLDLVAGRPKTTSPLWPGDPLEIATRAVELGVSRLLVLDLAGVGMAAGIRGLELVTAIHTHWPDLELITGGGVRSVADLESLAQIGVAGVLVASALHNGQLTAADIRRFQNEK